MMSVASDGSNGSGDQRARMRILAVAPWTPTARRPRSLRLLSMLSEEHELHLVCVAWTAEEQRDAESLPFPVTIVRLQRWKGILQALRALLRGTSMQQGFVTSKRLGATLRRVAESLRPDVFYFNVARSGHFVSYLRGLPGLRVIDLDELRSDYYRQMRTVSKSPIWRLIARLEAPRLARAEAAIQHEFDRVLFSSPLDVERWPDSGVLVRSPTRLTAEASMATQTHQSYPSIVFVGRLGYRANFEAIRWFAEHVWPTVASEFANLHLFIVGEKPGRAIKSLSSARVHVTGRVPDVEPYYARAKASIVPVRMATGVQLKLIEAMSSGTLAIVSPVVARGAGIQHGVHALVADDLASSWVAAIRSALSDAAGVARVELDAQTWVRHEYSDESIRGTLRSVVNSGSR